MKSLLVIPLILATTAAIAEPPRSQLSRSADAQAQAAALLSPHTFRTSKGDGHRRSPSPASQAMDAHARAAALLSGSRAPRTGNARGSIGQPSNVRTSGDAHAQAAALLRGSRTSTELRRPAQPAQSGVASGN